MNCDHKVIEVSNLSKAYKRYPNLHLRLLELFSNGYKKYHQLRWVLKDINFCIKPGEAVGVIGVNGAGKSTLLKLITKTSRPTSGAITTRGRIASLLELGLGFHQEFTGRQNITIAGQLMGYSGRDIQHMMPEIVEFADIGDYLDQPLRVYSSGMQMRLAYSVATLKKPDILIVDEALSIGDSYFQHKCFKRIRDLLKQGMALLFVSHENAAITSICDRAILLHNGSLVKDGKPEEVLNYYKALLADTHGKTIQNQMHVSGKMQTISGTGEAVIIEINLYNKCNEVINTAHVGESIRLNILVRANADLDELTLGYELKDVFGSTVFGINTFYLEQTLTQVISGEILEFNFEFAINLGFGTYSISVALHNSYNHLDKNYEWRDVALIFHVINIDKQQFIGGTWLPPAVAVNRSAAPLSFQSVIGHDC